MRLTYTFPLLCRLALAAFCLWAPWPVLALTACNERDCATRLMRGHIATQPGYWKSRMQRPLAQRIGEVPPELMEYVRLDNLGAGLASVPREATLTPDFLRDVRRALDEIPAPVKRLVGSRLAGIYLLEGLGSTGYTDTIFAADGNVIAALCVSSPRYRIDAAWNRRVPKAVIAAAKEISGQAKPVRQRAAAA